jgi:hypothetical protein
LGGVAGEGEEKQRGAVTQRSQRTEHNGTQRSQRKTRGRQEEDKRETRRTQEEGKEGNILGGGCVTWV